MTSHGTLLLLSLLFCGLLAISTDMQPIDFPVNGNNGPSVADGTASIFGSLCKWILDAVIPVLLSLLFYGSFFVGWISLFWICYLTSTLSKTKKKSAAADVAESTIETAPTQEQPSAADTPNPFIV